MQPVPRTRVRVAPGDLSVPTLSRRQGLVWAAVFTLIGAALRLLTLNSRSFWLDETTSVRQASWSLDLIIDRMSANVHPPLFHFLLHYWIRIFGRTEFAVRSMPLLFGVLAIPAAYWAASSIYNRRVGVFATGIVAFVPYFIWYSQEARMYSMMFFFAFLSTGTIYKAVRTNSFGWWALYALSTGAGLFTQYFFGFMVAAQALFILIFYVIARERELRSVGESTVRWSRPWAIFADCPTATRWLIAILVSLIPQAWWLPLVLGHGRYAEAYQSLSYGGAAPQLGWHFNEIILAASQGAFGMHSDTVTRNLSAMWPLVITAAFLVSGFLRRVSRGTWLLILSGLFSATIIAVLGQFAPVYEARYFMASGAPIAILFARFLAELRKPALQIVCVVFIVASLAFYVDQSYNPDSIVKWDNREAASSLAAQYKPGDVIVLVPYYASSVFEYYLPPDVFFAIRGVPLFNIDGKPRNKQPQLGEDLASQIGTAKRVWLVSSFYENPPIERDRKNVVLWLESRGFTRVSQENLHRVRVSLYETSQTVPFFYNSGGGQ